MFSLSVAYLAVLSAIVVLWVDVPMMHEPLQEQTALASGDMQPHLPVQAADALLRIEQALEAGYKCVLILGLLWTVFVVEFVFQYIVRDRDQPFWRTHVSGLLICFCPPLRLCARNHDMNGKIWLPGLRWRKVNASLRVRLERILSVPMILIALAILPVLLIEFGMRHQVAAHRWLQITLHVSLGVIWFAFAAEFIVMLSVADKKLRYCKGHWIDIAIILLPSSCNRSVVALPPPEWTAFRNSNGLLG
jgi:voltage-gated potassium channel